MTPENQRNLHDLNLQCMKRRRFAAYCPAYRLLRTYKTRVFGVYVYCVQSRAHFESGGFSAHAAAHT